MIRNAYGMLVVTVAAAVALVTWRGSSLVQAAFGYAMAWFLLLGGVRPVLELNRSRRRGRSAGSDSDQLAGSPGFPAGYGSSCSAWWDWAPSPSAPCG